MVEQATYEQVSSKQRSRSIQMTVKQNIGSIGAVLLALIATIIFSLGTDVLMHVANIYPPRAQPMNDILITMPCAWLGGKLRVRQSSNKRN